jgi:hypothetical protein
VSPGWRRAAGLALQVLWVVVKLALVVALLNRNAANFVYAGF